MEYARGVGGAKNYGILEHHGLKCGTSTENYGIRWCYTARKPGNLELWNTQALGMEVESVNYGNSKF